MKGGRRYDRQRVCPSLRLQPADTAHYDRVDLLKPASVNHWSGYRNYDEEQALAFVKIKNLQRAGFTIEEIKGLLSQEDATLYEAFTAKIAEAEENLRAIKAIQRSYRTEMNAMEKRIKEIRQTVHADLEAYDPKEEFGMDGAAYESLKQDVMRFFETIEKNASLETTIFRSRRNGLISSGMRAINSCRSGTAGPMPGSFWRNA